MNRDYPATIVEILDDSLTFNPEALRAVKNFAKSKPWRGLTVEERQEKFRQLNTALSAAYGIPVPILVFAGSGSDTGDSSYQPATNTIRLTGLSVVTLLHEHAHARGMGERGATKWSVNMFRRVWPRSFAKCQQVGHMLLRRDDRSGA
ncbi:MAG: hypothetical protein WCI73_00160 [Phycisphaerae bacterium]